MPPIRNPFIAPGPVPPERFIGRQKEINAILNRLTGTRPSSSAIHGELRIGKTSLLHYLRSDKVRQDWNISSNNFTFAYLDCGSLSDPVYINFWRTLRNKLKDEVQNPQVVESLAKLSINESNLTLVLQKFFKDLVRSNHRLVILLDEFENVTKSIPLLKILRAFVNEQDIGLVISTKTPLVSLVQGIDLGGGQPFEGPFDIRELKYFNRKETNQLINEALAGIGIEFDVDDYQYVWEISQGHPFKVQFACSRIFEDKVFSR